MCCEMCSCFIGKGNVHDERLTDVRLGLDESLYLFIYYYCFVSNVWRVNENPVDFGEAFQCFVLKYGRANSRYIFMIC